MTYQCVCLYHLQSTFFNCTSTNEHPAHEISLGKPIADCHLTIQTTLLVSKLTTSSFQLTIFPHYFTQFRYKTKNQLCICIILHEESMQRPTKKRIKRHCYVTLCWHVIIRHQLLKLRAMLKIQVHVRYYEIKYKN